MSRDGYEPRALDRHKPGHDPSGGQFDNQVIECADGLFLAVFDGLAEQWRQNRLNLRDEVVQIEDRRGRRLLAAEREQPLGQLRAARSSLLNRLDQPSRLMPLGQAAQQQLAASVYDRQQVIEVMRDPARETGDVRQSLRVLQLDLQAVDLLLDAFTPDPFVACGQSAADGPAEAADSARPEALGGAGVQQLEFRGRILGVEQRDDRYVRRLRPEVPERRPEIRSAGFRAQDDDVGRGRFQRGLHGLLGPDVRQFHGKRVDRERFRQPTRGLGRAFQVDH